MDLAHLHLLINHLPIFGSIIGALVMIQAISTKSESTNRAALGVYIISAVGAVIAYLTGEPAADKVEGLQGISKAAIEAHEEFAEIALIGMIILGVCSIGGFILIIRKSPYVKQASIAILVVSLISFGLVARTGYMGGEIRHSDVMNTQPVKGNIGDTLHPARPADTDNDKD